MNNIIKRHKDLFYTLSSKTISIYSIALSILFELSLLFYADTRIFKIMSISCLLISIASLIVLVLFSDVNKVRLMPCAMFGVMLLMQTLIISKTNYIIMLLISSLRLLIAILVLYFSVKVVNQKDYRKWKNLVWIVIALIPEKYIEIIVIYGFLKGMGTGLFDIINYSYAELFLCLFFLFISKPNEYKVNRPVYKKWFLSILVSSVFNLALIFSVMYFTNAPISIKTLSSVFVTSSLVEAFYINLIKKIRKKQSFIPSFNPVDSLYYLEEDMNIYDKIKELITLVEKRARNIKQTIENTDNLETKEYLKKYLEEVVEDHSLLMFLSQHANYKDYDLINDMANKYDEEENE